MSDAEPWLDYAPPVPKAQQQGPWMDLDKVVDKERGAPGKVRLLVGSAPQQDRLANLQALYPDAMPYGDDNFVFTDPDTRRPTLYNPSGIDAGDLFAVAREGAQVVGGALGAAGGAILGGASGVAGGPAAPVTIPGGAITGAIAGSGIGSATGGALFDTTANLLLDRIDTRTPGQVMLDTTLDVAMGAAGEGAGRAVASGARQMLGGSQRAVASLLASFTGLGIEAPTTAVSQGAARGLLKSLESSPIASEILQAQAARVLAQTKQAADDITAKLGTPTTDQSAGTVIREGAANRVKVFEATQEAIYEKAFNAIGPGTPVAVGNAKALRFALESELARAPQSLDKALTPVINRIKALEADAGNAGVPFDALRQVRTLIGREITLTEIGSAGLQNAALKRLYGVITEDMSAAAKSAGPAAAKQLELADRYTRAWMNTTAQTMDKVLRFETDERAFEFAMQAGRDGGTALSRLRRSFSPGEWDTVAATVFNRLGRATAGQQDETGEAFSAATFLSNWSKLRPEAKDALFGGSRYADARQAMDQLAEVAANLKDASRLTNTSNTARAFFGVTAIQALGGAAVGMAAGEDTGIGTAIGAVVAPAVAVKLMTNRAFVSWLAKGPPAGARSISGHLGRLVAIGEAEPAIREEIGQFISALRSIPSAEGDDQQKAD